MCSTFRNGFSLMLVLLVCVAAFSSCGVRSSQKIPEDGGYEGSNTILFSNTAANLNNAKEARTNGNFKKAADLFHSLYNDGSNDEDVRAESLFELGQIYSDLANPERDYNKAIELFETLLDEFPKSDFRDAAQRRIEKVAKFIGQ